MKADREKFLKFRWLVKYKTRVAAAALCDRGRVLRRQIVRTAGTIGRCACAAWRAAGYYICLAMLLVILGVAAYAYRMRPQTTPEQIASEPANASDEVVWSDFSAATPTPAPTEAPFALMQPVPGEILRPFEQDSLAWSVTLEQWQTHPGVDIAAELGEVVRAAEDGEIIGAYEDKLLGNVIEIRHGNGWITRYAALNTLALVDVGQTVERGAAISSAANTGYGESDLGVHVHFELLIDGEPAEPEFAAVAP